MGGMLETLKDDSDFDVRHFAGVCLGRLKGGPI